MAIIRRQNIYSRDANFATMKSPLYYFFSGVAVVGGLAWAVSRGKLSLGPLNQVFNADELTPADYEEMHIERSGSTLDFVPQALSEAFMGYQYLDLEHTTMVANDLPFGPGVIDHQAVYENGYDMGYDDDALIADMNRSTHPLQEYAPREMSAEAPGQGAVYGKLKETNSITPVGTLPGFGSWGYGPNVSGYNKLPPEVNRDFPYLVSYVNAPFKEVASVVDGDNRFGDMARNSVDGDLNGRFGQLSLDPSVNSGYTDGASTKSLDGWRQSYNLLRISDTMVRAIPMSGGEELLLRRV